MADLETIERALRNADAAGDVEAARALASEYQRITRQPMAEVGEAPPPGIPTSPAAAPSKYGFWQGASEAPKDLLLGLAQLGVKAREQLGIPTSVSSEEAQKFQKAREERIAEARGPNAGIDWGRLAGGAALTAPLALLPGGAVPASVAGGALSAALQPVGEGDFWTEKAKQAGLGAAGGAAGAGLIGGFGRLISPKLSRGAAGQLVREGITVTPGQALGGKAARIEQRATSVPLLGDVIKDAQQRGIEKLNVAAYNRALEPIGEKSSGKIGREGVAEVKSKLQAAYERVLPKLNFKADTQFVEEIQGLRDLAAELPDPQYKHFEKILQNKLFHRMPTGTMDGKTFKGVEEELLKNSKGYLKDASFDNRQLGEALDEALRITRNALHRSNQDAPELQAVNRGWANYARIRAAEKMVSEPEKGFTPLQFQSAVRSQSRGDEFAAGGNALMQDLSDPAAKVLASKYPDSGTAGRLMQALMAGGGGGWAYADPASASLAALGLGASMLPYTRAGQKAFEYGLLRRPAAAAPVGRTLGMLSPLGAPIGGTAASGLRSGQ